MIDGTSMKLSSGVSALPYLSFEDESFPLELETIYAAI